MSECDPKKEDLQIIKDLISKSKITSSEPAYAIDADWLNKFKCSAGYNCEPSGEEVGPIDNSRITNFYEKQLDKDFCIITKPVWNGLTKLYGGGPAVVVEVGFDPKNGNYIPLTQLHSFKIYFGEKMEKIMISKFKSIKCLIEAACEKFGLEDPSKYRLKDYWNHKEGRYLKPNQIICEYSLFVNTEMLLEEGSYENIEDFEENSKSSSIADSSANQSNSQLRAAFMGIPSSRALKKPDFQSNLISMRRGSHQIKNPRFEARTPMPMQVRKIPPLTGTPLPGMRYNAALFCRTPNPAAEYKKTEARTDVPSPIVTANSEPLIGVKGLVNIGNESHITSVLQCLIHLKPIKDYFLDKSINVELDPRGKQIPKNAPILAFASFVRNYYSAGNEIIDPCEVQKLLEKSAPFMTDYMQQNAHEILNSLLEALNETFKARPRPKSMSFSSEAERADIEWQEHMFRKDSIIAKLFYGQIRSCTTCTNCREENATFSPFTSIMLQLPTTRIFSPRFTFVPYDPKLPKLTLKLKLSDKFLYKDSFMKALEGQIGRHVECFFGIQDNDGIVEWVSGPDASITGQKSLVVYEIPDPNLLYISVRLAVMTNKFLLPTKCVEGPFLVPIPGPDTKKEQVKEILNDYFKYLYEPSTSSNINPELLSLIPSIKEAKDADAKIEVELAKSMFSKTMRFKPLPSNQNISSRGVTAIIQKTEGISWPSVVRQTTKNPSAPKKSEVELISLINDAATPTISSNTWKCLSCRKCVKPEKSTKIWRLPPILVFSLNRFEGTHGTLRKNDTPVIYPDVLQISDVTGPHIYNLEAVCEHAGKIEFGHYTAHAKIDDDTWAEFNDQSARKCKPEEAHQPNAHLLFYTMKAD